MERLTDFKREDKGIPVCLINVGYPELKGMIASMLDGHFRESKDDAPSLLITEKDGFLMLSSPHSGDAEILERPFTKEQLIFAAKEVGSTAPQTGFSADPEGCLAVLGDLSVRLTHTEFRLYSAILENGTEYISADELSSAVWGKSNRNLCTVYISYLRSKLDKAFGDGTLITASGKGYRLRGANNTEENHQPKG